MIVMLTSFCSQRYCLRENARTRHQVAPPIRQVRQLICLLFHSVFNIGHVQSHFVITR